MIAYTKDEHSNMPWNSISCYMYEMFLETTPQMFHTSTIWLHLALIITRYLLYYLNLSYNSIKLWRTFKTVVDHKP